MSHADARLIDRPRNSFVLTLFKLLLATWTGFDCWYFFFFCADNPLAQKAALILFAYSIASIVLRLRWTCPCIILSSLCISYSGRFFGAESIPFQMWSSLIVGLLTGLAMEFLIEPFVRPLFLKCKKAWMCPIADTGNSHARISS